MDGGSGQHGDPVFGHQIVDVHPRQGGHRRWGQAGNDARAPATRNAGVEGDYAAALARQAGTAGKVRRATGATYGAAAGHLQIALAEQVHLKCRIDRHEAFQVAQGAWIVGVFAAAQV
ncbi:hypothetical protein D9M71_841050 [compost metagenome]